MMNKRLWSKKPVGETILGQVSRRLAMQKAGIDHRSPSQRARDEKERDRLIRSFDRFKG